MIKEIATCLHYRYIKARHEDGTATPTQSLSRPILRAVRREGLGGLLDGIKGTREVLKLDESVLPTPVKEGIFWGGIMLGAVQFILVISGFKNRTGGNWQWYRDALSQ